MCSMAFGSSMCFYPNSSEQSGDFSRSEPAASGASYLCPVSRTFPGLRCLAAGQCFLGTSGSLLLSHTWVQKAHGDHAAALYCLTLPWVRRQRSNSKVGFKSNHKIIIPPAPLCPLEVCHTVAKLLASYGILSYVMFTEGNIGFSGTAPLVRGGVRRRGRDCISELEGVGLAFSLWGGSAGGIRLSCLSCQVIVRLSE